MSYFHQNDSGDTLLAIPSPTALFSPTTAAAIEEAMSQARYPDVLAGSGGHHGSQPQSMLNANAATMFMAIPGLATYQDSNHLQLHQQQQQQQQQIVVGEHDELQSQLVASQQQMERARSPASNADSFGDFSSMYTDSRPITAASAPPFLGMHRTLDAEDLRYFSPATSGVASHGVLTTTTTAAALTSDFASLKKKPGRKRKAASTEPGIPPKVKRQRELEMRQSGNCEAQQRPSSADTASRLGIENAASMSQPELRRTIHIIAEQRRRQDLNSGFDALCRLLPIDSAEDDEYFARQMAKWDAEVKEERRIAKKKHRPEREIPMPQRSKLKERYSKQEILVKAIEYITDLHLRLGL